MRIFGLLGYPLQHSWSPAYFSRKFQQENNTTDCYKLFPLENIRDFKSLLLSSEDITGLNVTIPYKIKIIPLLTEIDSIAAEIGSINTITIQRTNNQIITKGFNTDVLGFKKSIQAFLTEYHKNALVLGSGGASKSVIYVLKSLNINYTLVSRNPVSSGILSYMDLNANNINNYQLIINTTPVGQSPNLTNPLSPSIYSGISEKHLLFDLIYNPEETEFLKEGKKAGAICVNGLEMLRYQAEESWKIWNQK